ncbi:glucan endo-1,3-beta-D-glucosidase [Flavobacteriaceae bacterium]|nr:glucan endo-1,3-beta-D-glucosidase [Flavobacteriaceae bacterium]
MKYFKHIFSLFALVLIFSSCEEEETFEFGDLTAPQNLQISYEISGKDDANPNGDGSGLVTFHAQADNAITYRYIIAGQEILAPSGMLDFNFSTTGTEIYDVTAVAIGTGGSSSSNIVSLEVLVEYSPPADLLAMLHGDSERTWRVASETPGHFGVGPADGDTPIWYAAPPEDKAGLGMYDDRITFYADGTVYYDTMGDIFGKKPPIDAVWGDKGQPEQDNEEYWNYPLDAFSDEWFISAPGGVETLNYKGNASCGSFIGASSFQIVSRTDNTMEVRFIGYDGNAWYNILIAE